MVWPCHWQLVWMSWLSQTNDVCAQSLHFGIAWVSTKWQSTHFFPVLLLLLLLPFVHFGFYLLFSFSFFFSRYQIKYIDSIIWIGVNFNLNFYSFTRKMLINIYTHTSTGRHKLVIFIRNKCPVWSVRLLLLLSVSFFSRMCACVFVEFVWFIHLFNKLPKAINRSIEMSGKFSIKYIC